MGNTCCKNDSAGSIVSVSDLPSHKAFLDSADHTTEPGSSLNTMQGMSDSLRSDDMTRLAQGSYHNINSKSDHSQNNSYRFDQSLPSLNENEPSTSAVIKPSLDDSGNISLSSIQSSRMLLARKHNSSQHFLLCDPRENELGSIRYDHESLEDALQDPNVLLETGGLPIFHVQADIPGDRNAVSRILSHPLVVEAAESLFVSVCSTSERAPYTDNQGLHPPCDRPGPDRKAWYTTIRCLDRNGEELAPAIGGPTLSVGLVVETLIRARKNSGLAVPKYLRILAEEERGKQSIVARCNSSSGSGAFCSGPLKGSFYQHRQALFGVDDCYIAEVEFAGLEGIVKTQVGNYQRQKVIEVTYSGISYGAVLRFALRHDEELVQTEEEHSSTPRITAIYYKTSDEKVAAQMELGKEVPGQTSWGVKLIKIESPTSSAPHEQHQIIPLHDSKKALRRTELRYVPMTDLQSMWANRLVEMGSFHKATHLLSPRQGVILMKSYSNISGRKDAVDVPIRTAWKALGVNTA